MAALGCPQSPQWAAVLTLREAPTTSPCPAQAPTHLPVSRGGQLCPGLRGLPEGGPFSFKTGEGPGQPGHSDPSRVNNPKPSLLQAGVAPHRASIPSAPGSLISKTGCSVIRLPDPQASVGPCDKHTITPHTTATAPLSPHNSPGLLGRGSRRHTACQEPCLGGSPQPRDQTGWPGLTVAPRGQGCCLPPGVHVWAHRP